MENLGPVSRVLADPSTKLERFITSLARTAEIVAPVSEQQAQFFTNAAIAFDAIARDPEALKETISEGPPDARGGDRHAAAPAPLPRRVRRAFAPAAPGRPGPAHRPAGPQLGDRCRHARPEAHRRDEPRPARGARRARQPGRPGVHDDFAPAPRATRSTRHSTSPSGSCPPRPCATTGTTGSRSCPRRSRIATRSATASARRSRTRLPAPSSVQAGPLDDRDPGRDPWPGRRLLGRRRRSASADPLRIPPRTACSRLRSSRPSTATRYGPTGQKGTNADCQGGQSGYFLGQLPIAGQPADNPSVGVNDIPGSRGPTTLYYGDNAIQPDGTVLREFRDTRVASRQP